ncbi:MAG: FGGY family carbohydrate kinase, partial [Lentisphaerae bacterium]|nr:FGGY family carbohydrate kinase [Lentisphaerota bacterium]
MQCPRYRSSIILKIRGRKNFIAIDLGASNGRVIVGTLQDGILELKTAHRFHHSIIETGGCRRWDWKLISAEVDRGLFEASELMGDREIASISCDSWAQDFGLIDNRGELFYPPVSYRDRRTDGMPDNFSEIISPTGLFRENGSNISPITTLCQARAIATLEPGVFSRPSTLLFIADLIHFRLCGEKITDSTFATASQARSVHTNQWNADLLKALSIPVTIFPQVNNVPAVIGRVGRETAPHPKLAGVPVINGVGHDTAAATVAIHPMRRGTLFMSLGTWAMLGCCAGERLEERFLNDASTAVLGLPWGKW